VLQRRKRSQRLVALGANESCQGFRIHLRGVDQGHSWFATNEEEVLQNFVRIQGANLEKDGQKPGLDAARYRRIIRIIKERE
jgi:hypothetical protein